MRMRSSNGADGVIHLPKHPSLLVCALTRAVPVRLVQGLNGVCKVVHTRQLVADESQQLDTGYELLSGVRQAGFCNHGARLVRGV